MTLGTFLNGNKISLAAAAIGGAAFATGVVLYASVEINRQLDRLYFDEQLNGIRGELANLRSEISMLRTTVKLNNDENESVVQNCSFDALRAAAANGLLHVPSVQSVSSISSNGDFLDALDIFEDDIRVCTEQELAESFSKIDGTFDKPNEQRAAYDELKKLYGSNDSLKMNPELLWRLARSCHAVSNTYDDKNPKKKAVLFEGRDYAAQAYGLDENNFNALKWHAVLIGSVANLSRTQEKIEQGYIFKEYLDKAIAMQPTEYTLLHMRGRFAFSVANLSWLERKVASTLFAAPPQATLDEALEDFLAVEEIKPGCWIENLFYLVQVLLAKKDKAGAVKYMKIALEITPNDDADRQMLADIKRLLSKYS